MFFTETKNPDDLVFRVLEWMGYDNHFTIPPSVLSGGLALFWKSDVELEIILSCANFIDTKVKYKSKLLYVTFVYGHPETSKRKGIWDKLYLIAAYRVGGWLLTGEFNNIVDHSEKRGGPQQQESFFVNFRTFYSQNGLWDVNHFVDQFSWRGMHYGHFVRIRLNKTLSNVEWLEDFPSGMAKYLRCEGFNHQPLITYIDYLRIKRKSMFRLDHQLCENEVVHKFIDHTWKERKDNYVDSKIIACRPRLIAWTKEQSFNSGEKLELLQQNLEQALSSDFPEPNVIAKLKGELEEKYKTEEALWKQRSRLVWLQEGDRNSAFFFQVTRGKRAINRLTMLEDIHGTAFHEENEFTR